jgi:hypothetical protein
MKKTKPVTATPPQKKKAGWLGVWDVLEKKFGMNAQKFFGNVFVISLLTSSLGSFFLPQDLWGKVIAMTLSASFHWLIALNSSFAVPQYHVGWRERSKVRVPKPYPEGIYVFHKIPFYEEIHTRECKRDEKPLKIEAQTPSPDLSTFMAKGKVVINIFDPIKWDRTKDAYSRIENSLNGILNDFTRDPLNEPKTFDAAHSMPLKKYVAWIWSQLDSNIQDREMYFPRVNNPSKSDNGRFLSETEMETEHKEKKNLALAKAEELIAGNVEYKKGIVFEELGAEIIQISFVIEPTGETATYVELRNKVSQRIKELEQKLVEEEKEKDVQLKNIRNFKQQLDVIGSLIMSDKEKSDLVLLLSDTIDKKNYHVHNHNINQKDSKPMIILGETEIRK